MSKPALGRGLSALLGGKPSGTPPPVGESPEPSKAWTTPSGEAGGVAVEWVPVGRIKPSSLQPRREFPEAGLKELSDSIREQGILQPLVVRPKGEGLELIAGERRWRAAQMAGLTEVPVLVRQAEDATALECMLVENLQREDLNPMDEAQGYSELIDRFHLTQEGVASRVGRSRVVVANALRLLKLPAQVQGAVRERRLSAGHAKVILGLGTPALQLEAAERVMRGTLSVRETEELVARLPAVPVPDPTPSGSRSPGAAARDPHVMAVEDQLRQRLGTRVTVRYRQGRGQIDIRFFSDAELERVLEIVGVRLE